jgi:hypothetical protein
MRRGIFLLVVMLGCSLAVAGDNVVTVALSGGDFENPVKAAEWVADQSPSATNRYVILVEPGIYDLDRSLVMPDYTTLRGLSRQQTILKRGSAKPLPPHGAVVELDGLSFASIESLTLSNNIPLGVGSGVGVAVYIENSCYTVEIKDCLIETSGGGTTVDWLKGVISGADHLTIESSKIDVSSNHTGVIGLYQTRGDVKVRSSEVNVYRSGGVAYAIYQNNIPGSFPTFAMHGSQVDIEPFGYYYYRSGDGSGGFYHCQIERGSLTNAVTHHYLFYCHDGGLVFP